MIVIPQGGENVGSAWPDVHGNGGGPAQLDVWHGGDRKDMPARRDEVIVAAPLDNICHGSAIDLQIGDKVPSEVRGSDYNQTTSRLTCRVIIWDRRKKDKSEQQSAEVAR
jgi:hypothetical protein